MSASDSPIRLPSRVGFFWLATMVVGWPMIGYAAWQVWTAPRIAMPAALITTGTMVVVLELLPVAVNLRHWAKKIVISAAFVFAIMFIWGPWPAIAIRAVGSMSTDLRSGRQWYKTLYNPALYAITTLAASVVITGLRGPSSLSDPISALHAGDLPSIALGCLVWFVVNHAVVAGVITGLMAHMAKSPRAFGRDALLNLGVLAMAPLIVGIALTHWFLTPLLLTPLLLLRWTGQVAVDREREAAHDALTGLPNRIALSRGLEQALPAVDNDGASFALMLIDLNDFKRVNDTLGHQVGDALLVCFGERLAGAVPDGDCVVRLGGDEFAVLVHDVERARAVALAATIREAVTEPVVIDAITLEIDFSLGIALYPEHGRDATTLLRHADVAMYQAKEQQLGVAVYSFEGDDNSTDQLELISDLRGALRSGEVQLHYQPKVAAADGAPVGFEALARWHHPVRGPISPERFVALAERSGLMPNLTAHVVELAAQQAVLWRRLGFTLPIAVNVSPSDVSGDELVALVASTLHRHGLDPSLLVLEITEQVSTTRTDHALRNLGLLRAMGTRISLDDFGTGYSSLARLNSLPVDELKIDRVFVSELAPGHESVSTARALIDLAHARGLPTVAEGVERAEQWRVLASLGCDTVQGWHIAHPMSAADATAWLRSRPAKPAPWREGITAVV